MTIIQFLVGLYFNLNCFFAGIHVKDAIDNNVAEQSRHKLVISALLYGFFGCIMVFGYLIISKLKK